MSLRPVKSSHSHYRGVVIQCVKSIEMTSHLLPLRLSRFSALPAGFTQTITNLSSARRKVLLDYVRIQTHYGDLLPDYLPSFTQTLSEQVPLFDQRGVQIGFIELYKLVPDTFTLPTFSAFFSMLIRSAPFTTMETERIGREALIKELRAAKYGHHPTEFSWRLLFFESTDPSQHYVPDHANLVTPSAIRYIRYRLDKSKRSFSHVLYPATSSKGPSRQTREDAEPFREWFKDQEFCTMTDLLRIFHYCGVKIGGETEMRQSWGFNVLSPRTYYARGGADYFASLYIQPVLNIIVDCLPATHRRTRFNFNLLEIEGKTFFIYDYSSFTSNLTAFRGFLIALAEFYQDTFVTIFDVHHGEVEVNLGEMIMQYAEDTTLNAEFSVERFLNTMFPEEPYMVDHNTGMLGIPGNIFGCTLAHGLHLMVLLGVTCCKCVGDDAIGVLYRMSPEVIEWIQMLGDIALDKFEFWDEDDPPEHVWKYVKRPIFRVGNTIQSREILDIPSLHLLLNTHNLPGRIPHNLPHDDAIKRTRNMLNSLFLRAARFPFLTDEEVALLEQIRIECDRRFDLSRKPFVVIRDFSVVRDGVMGLIRQNLDQLVSWPCYRVDHIPFRDDDHSCYMPMNAKLSLAIKMGYYEAEQVRSKLYVRDDVDRILLLFSGSARPLYLVYPLVSDIPEHFTVPLHPHIEIDE
jgi:hypothetical protein